MAEVLLLFSYGYISPSMFNNPIQYNTNIFIVNQDAPPLQAVKSIWISYSDYNDFNRVHMEINVDQKSRYWAKKSTRLVKIDLVLLFVKCEMQATLHFWKVALYLKDKR